MSRFLPLEGLLTAKSHSGPWISSLSDMAPIQTLVSFVVVSLIEVAEVFDRADLEVVMDPEPKGRPDKTFGTTCLISVLQSAESLLLYSFSLSVPIGHSLLVPSVRTYLWPHVAFCLS